MASAMDVWVGVRSFLALSYCVYAWLAVRSYVGVWLAWMGRGVDGLVENDGLRV